MSGPLDGLFAWVGESLVKAADDKLVDGLVSRGDISPDQAPVLKTAGPIYLQAVLAEVQRASQNPKPVS